MFDAYKVAVHLSIVDKVSPILGMMSKRLQATGRDVSELEKRLGSLGKMAAGGGVLAAAGYGILGSLKGPMEAAMEFEQAARRFKQLNLGEAVNADAQKFAKGAQLFGVNSIELMDTIRDMHAVVGNYAEAKELAPKIAQLSMANGILFGGKGKIDEGEARALMKVSEMRGGKNSPQDFMRELEVAQKFISGTGGAVTAKDLRAFSARAGLAMRGLTDDAFLKWEPLIQELGGSSAGTAFMSMYQNLVGGRTTKRAAEELVSFGLLDPKMIRHVGAGAMDIRPGALKDAALAKSDMIAWIQKDLLPAIMAKGFTSPDQIVGIINTLLTNRTGANVASITATQMDAIMKNFGVNKNAFGTDQTIQNANDSSIGKLNEFHKRLDDLKIAIGEQVLPATIKLVHSLTEMFKWLKEHPRLLKALTGGFVALGAALAISGTVLLLVSGFGALALVLGVTLSPVLLIGAGIAVIGVLLWTFWDKVTIFFGDFFELADKIGEKIVNIFEAIFGWIGKIWERVTDFFGGGEKQSGGRGANAGRYTNSMTPTRTQTQPSASGPTPVHVVNTGDIARGANNYVVKAANKPSASGTNLDFSRLPGTHALPQY